MKLESKDSVYGLTTLPKDFVKKINQKSSSTDFKKYSEHERVWIRPDLYMGSCEMIKRTLPIYNFETGYIENREITTPKALERLFIEILTNATDGIRKSNENGCPADHMSISMTPTEISITNYSLPIPIEPHEDECHDGKFGTTADLIFGNLGSGSNLDDEYERTGAGANGLGAKLTNIFSKYFNVEIGDNIRGCHQEILWVRNMVTKVSSKCTPQYIKKNGKWKLDGQKYDAENFVRVTWGQDFRKFRESENDYHYFIEDLLLFTQHIIVSSLSSSVKIDFLVQGFFEEDFHELIDYRDINKLASIINSNPESRIITYTLHDIKGKKNKDENEELKISKKEISKKIISREIVPIIQMCIIDSPNNGYHISHCNGIPNARGGAHTDEAYRVSFDFIKDILMSDKSFKMIKEDVEKMTIRIIKQHAVVLVSYNCDNPQWENQEKEKVTKPKPKIVISKEDSKDMKKWKMLESIYDSYHSKPKSTSSTRKKKIVSEGFIDANLVCKKGIICTAIPCEGKSAGGYVDEFIMSLKSEDGKYEGFDVYAKIPLRGKIKNTYGMSSRQIDAPLKDGSPNELSKFIENMGFEDGLDYTIKENGTRLRYQFINVMVDADSDGSHILCLLINFIFLRYPSFIKANRLKWTMTPIIRAMTTNGRFIEKFYNINDYNIWKESNNKIKHKAIYFKGLASSNRELAKADAKNAPNVVLYFDVAFSQDKESPDIRKEWIQSFAKNINEGIIEKAKEGIDISNFVRISNLINTKLIEYSLETLPRALVSIYDQFKLSQRQVVYYLLKEYNYGKSDKEPMKLSEISGAASLLCKYHHGDLAPTVAKMAEDFSGSNNLPFGICGGMVGTRTYLGKDCGAPRYVTTSPNWWVEYIFKKDLIDLVEREMVEGKEVQPKWIPSLLPLSVINGTKGISTGWSSTMTNYHPIDVCKWIKRFISGQKVFPMVPWYIKFKGNVLLEMKTKVFKKTHLEFSDEENLTETYTGLTCRTEGIYKINREYKKEITVEIEDPSNPDKKKKEKKIIDHYDLEITEVPIGVEPSKLYIKLSALCENPSRKTKDADEPHFVFEGYHGSIDPRCIGMVSREGLSNITMVDDTGGPVSYKNIYEAMDTFCAIMDEIFKKNKENKLKILKQEMENLEMKLFLIRKVITNEWVYIRASKDKIKKDLDDFKIPHKVFTSIGGEQYTEYGAQEIEDEFSKKEKQLKKTTEVSHLQDWIDYLDLFLEEISKRKEYKKLDIHEYDLVECNIEDLIEGRILAPYDIQKNAK